MRTLALAVALAMTAPSTAAAQQDARDDGRLSFALRAGYASPRGADLARFDGAAALEAGVAYRVSQHLAIEASIGRAAFAASRSYTARLAPSPDSLAGLVEVREERTVYPLHATMKAFLPAGPVELFALGGFGGYLVSTRVTVRLPMNLRHDSSDGEKVGLGLHAGAGVAVRLDRRVRVGVETRYVLAKTNADVDPRLDHLVVVGGLSFVM